MKHTFKTVLTTTLLTVPTAFGSEQFDESADQLASADARAVVVAATACSTPILNRLHGDVIRCVAAGVKNSFDKDKGENVPIELEVGFLDMKDVSNLGLVSSGFNAFAQPVLDRSKAWQQTNVIPKLLQSAPFDPEDQKKINFLGTSTEASVDNILKIAGAVKYLDSSNEC